MENQTNQETADYAYTITLDSGNKARVGWMEGHNTIAHYNGPIKSTYPNTPVNGALLERHVLIFKDVVFTKMMNPEKEKNGILSILAKHPSHSPGNADMWIYTNMVVEGLEPTEVNDLKSFKRVEISYTKEKYYNSFFEEA